MLLAAEVARSMHFSRPLVELADRVVHGVTHGGTRGFNGLHLRMEDDVAGWFAGRGGLEVRT